MQLHSQRRTVKHNYIYLLRNALHSERFIRVLMGSYGRILTDGLLILIHVHCGMELHVRKASFALRTRQYAT